MFVEGSCYCGAVAFTGEVDPEALTLCHCDDCQRMSGSAFRANVSCLADKFRLVQGEPKVFVKIAESGSRRAMAFCGDCGTQLYASDADGPSAYSVRSGTLKQRAEFTPGKQIWLRSATPWARDLVDVPSYEKDPPR